MSTRASPDIPPTHRALLLNSTRDPFDISVVSHKTPSAGPGSAVIRVLATSILTYAGDVYSGRKVYPYPTPFVPGSAAVGRVVEVGPDASAVKPGQLVYFDSFVQARDDPSSLILQGLSSGFTPNSTAIMESEWRHGTYAEYTKIPLENCFSLDETRLLGDPANGGLGYKVQDLMYLLAISVGFGGLRDIGLQAGDKVVISPAMGFFGGAAALAAVAMGAQVIAMGRNADALERLKAFSPEGRITTVLNTGDVVADTKELTKNGLIDAFFDISPKEAAGSTHFNACIQALKRGGRVSLMGAHSELSLPIMTIMLNDITIKGKWMYEKEDIRAMIRLVEAGYLKLGDLGGIKTVASFSLEQYEAAFEAAADNSGPGLQVVIVP